ncbi:MAG: MerR family transcriptional regulator [Bryobacteraceae bacterium]
MSKAYTIQEFARLAGVTVRALHHYDRLGLLRPDRSVAGYRLYHARDLERLEQIVALKFIGIPLNRIKALLGRDRMDLPAALQLQRAALEEKRCLLDRALNAIRKAEQSLKPGRAPDAEILSEIIEAIEMQSNTDWMKKYYSDEAWEKIRERGQSWTPELQAQATRDWAELFHDVEAALGEDPASEKGQALAARWAKLLEGFTGRDPGITAGLKNLYADKQAWPDSQRQQAAAFSNPKVWEFINRALSCRPSVP